jgi:hypothetical protein
MWRVVVVYEHYAVISPVVFMHMHWHVCTTTWPMRICKSTIQQNTNEARKCLCSCAHGLWRLDGMSHTAVFLTMQMTAGTIHTSLIQIVDLLGRCAHLTSRFKNVHPCLCHMPHGNSYGLHVQCMLVYLLVHRLLRT